jgi:hypothetical protein
MKKSVLILAISLLGTAFIQAQTSNVTTEPLKVQTGYREFENAYVMPKYEQWATKDLMGESTQEHLDRLKSQSVEKMNQYRKEAKATYLNYVKDYYKTKGVFESFNLTSGHYNSDINRFTINIEGFDPIVLTVLRGEEAKNFLNNWNRITKIPTYNITDEGKLILEKLECKTPDGRSYLYDSKIPILPEPPVDRSYGDKVAEAIAIATKTLEEEEPLLPVDTFNVDINIPKTDVINDKTFVLIIANENYQNVSNVEFALNDGKIFHQYCLKTLGIPTNRIFSVENATLGNIQTGIDNIQKAAEAYKEEATFIFYYAGHGIPDDKTSTAYLLPVDGSPSNVKTAFSLDELCQTFGSLPVKSVIMFIDACFSGAKRNGTMMLANDGSRGVARHTEQGDLSGNTVLLAAAASKQTAYPYRKQKHGLFTYFLLRKLKETQGNVTLGELSQYLKTKVAQRTVDLQLETIQTPTATTSPALKDKWETMKLK